MREINHSQVRARVCVCVCVCVWGGGTLHMKPSQTGCWAPCRQSDLYTSMELLTAISLSVYSSSHAPPVVNTTPHSPHTNTHTHTKSALIFLSVSHPHSVTWDQCVVAPAYVPFSAVTFHHMCTRAAYSVCVRVRPSTHEGDKSVSNALASFTIPQCSESR